MIIGQCRKRAHLYPYLCAPCVRGNYVLHNSLFYIKLTIKNLNIEEYLLGRCDAQQMHQLATCVVGSNKRLRLLFALRCAFLDLKSQHYFDDANFIAAAEQRLFDAIPKG